MTILANRKVRISETTHRKLQERSGVLYCRALERWNCRNDISFAG